MATGPSAAQMLCLDLRVHTPDESGTSSLRGSSCGNPSDESEGGGTGSSHASPADKSKCTGSSADESESEGTESSRVNSSDNMESSATSRSKGSFNWDREKGGFNLEWTSLAELE